MYTHSTFYMKSAVCNRSVVFKVFNFPEKLKREKWRIQKLKCKRCENVEYKRCENVKYKRCENVEYKRCEV